MFKKKDNQYSSLHNTASGNFQYGPFGSPFTRTYMVSDTASLPADAYYVSVLGTSQVYQDQSGALWIVDRFNFDKIPTKEEVSRLKELKEKLKEDTKKAKLEAFKKLPSGLRQHVINALSWDEAVDMINNTTVEKPQEMVELEKKHLYSQNGGAFGSYTGMFQQEVDYNYLTKPYSPVKLPRDFTAEELIRAHNEATLEEELINTDSK